MADVEPTLAHRIFVQNLRDLNALPPADVSASDIWLLSRLLRHAAANVPAFRPLGARLEAAADGDRDAWTSLPLLQPADFERAAERSLATALPETESLLPDERSWTSLATAIAGPLGRLTDIADRAQWESLVEEQAIETSQRLAAILPAFAVREGDLAGGRGPWSFEGKPGEGHVWSDRSDMRGTIAWLANVRARCLFAHPRTLEGLLDHATPKELTFRDALCWWPAQSPALAERCRRRLGARLVEAISSDLCGLVARPGPGEWFAPAVGTMYVVVVGASGRPSPPGEPGRLVATALYSYHRPIIRLDLGLRAIASPPAADSPLATPARFRLIR